MKRIVVCCDGTRGKYDAPDKNTNIVRLLLEGFPGLARGQPGLPAQPVDASVAAILSFLLQYLQESCQGIAVSSGGETSHRLGAHGGQLELAAQLADAVLHHAGVRHAHTPAAARLTVSRRS